MTDTPDYQASEPIVAKAAKKPLSPAAQRALAEAQARRDADCRAQAEEIGGRGGLDPARYGDWEVKGIASDF